jgi:hypothetical protein
LGLELIQFDLQSGVDCTSSSIPLLCSARYDAAAVGEKKDFVGTPDYASSAALLGRRTGYRDDCEALGYTLLELCLGEMPW